AEAKRKQRRAGGVLHGVEEQPEGLGAEISGTEIVEREHGGPRRGLRGEKTLPQQEHPRHERKTQHPRDRHGDQKPSRVEPLPGRELRVRQMQAADGFRHRHAGRSRPVLRSQLRSPPAAFAGAAWSWRWSPWPCWWWWSW